MFNPMVEKRVKITNILGLHARSAAQVVKLAQPYEACVWFVKDGIRADGKSILDLLTLAGTQDSEIVIVAEGKDEIPLFEGLVALVENKFGED